MSSKHPYKREYNSERRRKRAFHIAYPIIATTYKREYNSERRRKPEKSRTMSATVTNIRENITPRGDGNSLLIHPCPTKLKA